MLEIKDHYSLYALYPCLNKKNQQQQQQQQQQHITKQKKKQANKRKPNTKKSLQRCKTYISLKVSKKAQRFKEIFITFT